jgi:hypothetical protein
VRGGIGLDRLPIAPTLDREFGVGDTLRIVCDFAKRSPEEADITIDLLSGAGGPVRRVATRRVNRAETSRLDETLPLRGLAPGGYRLRVTAVGGTFSVHREVGFVLK